MMVRAIFVILPILTLVLFGPDEARAGRCEDSVKVLEQISSNGEFVEFQSGYERVSAECPSAQYPQVAYCSGRSAALSIYEDAVDLQNNSKEEAAIERRLNEGLTFGRPWQLLNALGETASRNGFHGAAARYFQLAMNELSLPALPCPSEEAAIREWSKAELRKLVQNLRLAAETQLLLADSFEKPPGDRSGNPGGIFLTSMRGIGIAERSLPIVFEFDSTVFTVKGLEAFSALSDYVKRRKYGSLLLSGHTDSVGKPEYNCDLASRRLKVIADALYQEIPGIRITAIPVGEFEPFEADSAAGLSEDQIKQLNRRVKLIENGKKPVKACK